MKRSRRTIMAAPMVRGFVVAGGQSSRMGQDKARLPYRETTLLEHAIVCAGEVTSDVRILCGPARRYEDAGVPVVQDAICGAGPISGLYSALLSASVDGQDRIFWLAVDLPLVPPAFVMSLVRGLDRADVVMAGTERGPEPLCAAFQTEPTLAAVRRALFEGRLKLTSALDGLLIHTIAGDAATFANINTLGDYDHLGHPQA
ncbi:MAG: molybdenum cofactor guanylyltransferase [Vicinamibacteria bacterium]